MDVLAILLGQTMMNRLALAVAQVKIRLSGVGFLFGFVIGFVLGALLVEGAGQDGQGVAVIIEKVGPVFLELTFAVVVIIADDERGKQPGQSEYSLRWGL